MNYYSSVFYSMQFPIIPVIPVNAYCEEKISTKMTELLHNFRLELQECFQFTLFVWLEPSEVLSDYKLKLITTTTGKMKKKLSISVVDIIHRNTQLPSHNPHSPKKPGAHLQATKPLRFEELYKQAISGHSRLENQHGHHASEHPLSRHTTAKTTPLNSRRVKKVPQTCSLNCNKKSQVSSCVSSLANSGKKTMPSSVPSHRLVEPFKENVNENGGADCTPLKVGGVAKCQGKERDLAATQ
jgi:hypothetical protein